MSKGTPVDRNIVVDRFAKFAIEGRAEFPPGYSAPLEVKPIRQLIREQRERLLAQASS